MNLLLISVAAGDERICENRSRASEEEYSIDAEVTGISFLSPSRRFIGVNTEFLFDLNDRCFSRTMRNF